VVGFVFALTGNRAAAQGQNVQLVGSYDTPGKACGVYVTGGLAYVADGSGLQIIAISNPSSPTLRGSYNTPGVAYGVYVTGGLAYIGDDWSGLQIIDVSNPSSPTRRGSHDTGWSAGDVYVSGGLAYLCDGNNGLLIIDVSNPAAPTRLGSYATNPCAAQSVYVTGGLAYVAASSKGLLIIDVSNPAAPTRLGSYLTGVWGFARGVYVTGGLAYVADDSKGLLTIDVSNPAAPTLRGSYDMPEYAEGVYVAGGLAYVADGGHGLLIIDVSNPAAPTLRGSYDTPGDAEGVYVTGGLAYVADGASGLWILQYTGDAPKVAGVILQDSDGDGVGEAGESLIIQMDRNVVVDVAPLRASHFFLPVAGDSLGRTGFAVQKDPVNKRRLILKLGQGARLTARAEFSMSQRLSGAPSGIDLASSFPKTAVISLEGRPAVDGGVRANYDDSGVDIWPDCAAITPGVAVAGQFTAAGASQFYKVTVAATEHLLATLDDLDNRGSNELYLRYGLPPTRSTFDARYETNFAADQDAEIIQTEPGTYYILAYGDSVPNPPSKYTLKAQKLVFFVRSVSPSVVGNTGRVSLEVKGSHFTPATTFTLVRSGGGASISSYRTIYFDSSRMCAMFQFNQTPVGVYNMVAKKGTATANLSGALTIEAVRAPELSFQVEAPSAVRPNVTAPLRIHYENRGNVNLDMTGIVVTYPTSVGITLALPFGWPAPGQSYPQFGGPLGMLIRDLSPGCEGVIEGSVIARAAGAFPIKGWEWIPPNPAPTPVSESTAFACPAVETEPFSVGPPENGSWVYQWTPGENVIHIGLIYHDVENHYGNGEWVILEKLDRGPYMFVTSWDAFVVRTKLEDHGWLGSYKRPGLTDDQIELMRAKFDDLKKKGSPYDWLNKCSDLCNELWKAATGNDIIPGFGPWDGPGYLYYRQKGEYPPVWNMEIMAYALLSSLVKVSLNFPPLPLGLGTAILRQTKQITVVRSWDPNEKIAPAGYGPLRVVRVGSAISYTVLFENDPAHATAPAQCVEITDRLSPLLDWSTFEFDEIAFGEYVIRVPNGMSHYTTSVLTIDLPGGPQRVDVRAGLNIATGVASCTLQCIDPNTDCPPTDPMAGFLPPNDAKHRGEGHVTFTVRSRRSAPMGATIRNSATIKFDTNPPVTTNEVMNRIGSENWTSARSNWQLYR
jgi:hypothetical protein